MSKGLLRRRTAWRVWQQRGQSRKGCKLRLWHILLEKHTVLFQNSDQMLKCTESGNEYYWVQNEIIKVTESYEQYSLGIQFPLLSPSTSISCCCCISYTSSAQFTCFVFFSDIIKLYWNCFTAEQSVIYILIMEIVLQLCWKTFHCKNRLLHRFSQHWCTEANDQQTLEWWWGRKCSQN